MTATLWINTASEETIELGGTIPLYQAVRNMSVVAEVWGKEDFYTVYPDLGALLHWIETQDDIPPEILFDMKAQAEKFTQKYEENLAPHTLWVLDRITGKPEVIEEGQPMPFPGKPPQKTPAPPLPWGPQAEEGS